MLRNGAIIPIAASDLVPGDVVEVTGAQWAAGQLGRLRLCSFSAS